MKTKRVLAISLFVAVAGSLVIGRVLHALGLRHSGGHMLAELVAVGIITAVALLVRYGWDC